MIGRIEGKLIFRQKQLCSRRVIGFQKHKEGARLAHPPQKFTYLIGGAPDDWTEEWFRQVGFVGYYFGQLEWVPYLLSDRVGCSNTKRRKLPKLTFAERCRFAKAELLPKIADSTLRQEWEKALDDVSKCGKMRNDILHNPLELNVAEINAHGIKVDQGIRLLKQGGKILSIGDVQHFSRSMRDLHIQVIELLARTPTGP
jgi:hypothetical protein